jgi:type IV pilus assembly protein PilE
MHRILKGFSLIELMVVVAIIAILGAIAYPNYNRYILKSRRTEAMSNLLKNQAIYEEYNAQNNVYPTANTLPPSTTPPMPSSTYYSFSSVTTSTSYTLTATAVVGSSQVNDTEGSTNCSVLSIDNIGIQTPNVCWTQ